MTSPSLRTAVALSPADRRWIDFLTQTVNDTWDEANPSRPKTLGYVGSEEFIRLQFEEYLLALLSASKYRTFLQSTAQTGTKTTPIMADGIEGDPSVDFGTEFLLAWQATPNYTIFNIHTDSHLFDIVEPKHPCAGGLTIEDVQRRLAQQVSELHLDERVRDGREVLNKHLATGQKRVSSAFNNLWADIEAMREAQRKRAANAQAPTIEEARDEAGMEKRPTSPSGSSQQAAVGSWVAGRKPDLSNAQASVAAAGQKAGAYFSSWGSWAAEKKKDWATARQNEGLGGEEKPFTAAAAATAGAGSGPSSPASPPSSVGSGNRGLLSRLSVQGLRNVRKSEEGGSESVPTSPQGRSRPREKDGIGRLDA